MINVFGTNPVSTTVMYARYVTDIDLLHSKNYAMKFPVTAGRKSLAHVGCTCRQPDSKSRSRCHSRQQQVAPESRPTSARHLNNPITQTLTFSTINNRRHTLSPLKTPWHLHRETKQGAPKTSLSRCGFKCQFKPIGSYVTPIAKWRPFSGENICLSSQYFSPQNSAFLTIPLHSYDENSTERLRSTVLMATGWTAGGSEFEFR
jgi:hypothetical protein